MTAIIALMAVLAVLAIGKFLVRHYPADVTMADADSANDVEVSDAAPGTR